MPTRIEWLGGRWGEDRKRRRMGMRKGRGEGRKKEE